MKKRSNASKKPVKRGRSTASHIDGELDGSALLAVTKEFNEETLMAKALADSISASVPSQAAIREEAFFDSFCSSNGFVLRTVLGDGHCLFRCMYELFGEGSPEGSHYRQLAAAHMRRNDEIYRQEHFTNLDGSERLTIMMPAEFSAYVDAVERGVYGRGNAVVYGDHLCLIALSETLQVVFNVVRCEGPVIQVPDTSPEGWQEHFLSYHRYMYAGPHYNLLLTPGRPVQPSDVSLLPPVGRSPPDFSPVGMCHPAEGPPHGSRDDPVGMCHPALEPPSANLTGFHARERIIKPHYLNVALLCASAGRPHSSQNSATSFKEYDSAVIEVRDTLAKQGLQITWAPHTRGTNRNAMPYSNAHNAHEHGDEHVSGAVQQSLFNAVLRVHPNGSLKRFLTEIDGFNKSAEAALKQGKLPPIPRTYLTPSGEKKPPASASYTGALQKFRSTGLEAPADSSSESRLHLQKILDAQSPRVRRCPVCNVILLGSSGRAPFAEADSFCCSYGARLHDFWHPLPDRFGSMVFTKCARVINCLLSPTTLHGGEGEGIGYRHLSYQAPVMTICGQMYARFMRSPSNCWFLQDASYDKCMFDLLQNEEQRKVLSQFHALLVQKHALAHVLTAGIRVADALRTDQRVWVTMNDDTRLCAVYVTPDVSSGPARTS